MKVFPYSLDDIAETSWSCFFNAFFFRGSVMAVQFVRNTHYMFSVGKDRLVKYWDADKFELLLTLEGHHADIWCLAISNRGDFVVTGSHDRSIRRWDRTEEPFFIEVSVIIYATTLILFHANK